MRILLVAIAVLLAVADGAVAGTVASGPIDEADLTGERVVYVRADSEGQQLVEARGDRRWVLARSEPREIEGVPLRVVRLEASDEAALVERAATTSGRIPMERRRDVAGVAGAGALRAVEACQDGICSMRREPPVSVAPSDARLLDATGTCLLLERSASHDTDDSMQSTLITSPFPGLSPDACPA